jgi:hypothetical protein
MKVTHASICLLGILGVTAASSPVLAQPSPCPALTPIVLAGQTNLAFIDTNGNMMLDASDCVLTGVGQQTGMMGSVAMGNACYTAQQGSPPFITGCNDTYPGTADLDSSSGEGSAEDTIGGITIMYSSGSSSPSPSPSPAIGGPGGAGGFPVPLISASVVEEGMVLGEGLLCDAGGPAVRATIRGVSGIARFNRVSIGGVVHGCAPLPFPLTTGGQATFPLCIPIGTGNPQGGLQGGPIYVEFPLNSLPGCGGFQTPSASEWGLLGLASVLLVLGTWALRRRPAFGAALPQI